MRATGPDDAALVRAAAAGDRAALDELVTTYLPMVATIVRQALGEHPDADDVVQDVMLRAMRQLGSLRSPESFRPWLAAIAVHQVGTHQHRAGRAAARTAPLDEAADLPDTGARFEGVTDLTVALSAQRRQAERAGHWLDADDRALLPLWWLETAGRLSRAELAQALRITVVHAGVRVQRMRAQLELSRTIVAALDARPRCAGLDAELAGWDGTPSPLWRKRLARHVRACPVCARAGGDLIAVDRLLPGLVLVPATVTAAVLAKIWAGGGAAVSTAAAAGSLAPAAAMSGALTPAAAAAGPIGPAAGVFGHVAALAAAHPVVATVAAGALAAGVTVGAVRLSGPAIPPVTIAAPTPAPGSGPAPGRTGAGATGTKSPVLGASPGTGAGSPAAGSPAAGSPAAGSPAAGSPAAAGSGSPAATGSPDAPLRAGTVSLESANAAGRFVTASADLGMLTAVGPGNTITARRQATWQVVAGLADARCFSFRVTDGRYLRHASWRARLDPDQGTGLFRGDATFCPRPGTVAGSVRLEAANYPGWFLRHRGDELWVDQSDSTGAFRADSSFLVRAPLGD